MDINFNWLPTVLLSAVKSPQTRVPVIIIGVLTIALIVGWCGGAKFQDRAAKLDVLHRLAGYRFLTRPGYTCRIKDQLIFALNQVPTIYADHDDVTETARRLSERPDLLAGLQDLIDAMAKAAGVTPPPRDSTPFGITSPLCSSILSGKRDVLRRFVGNRYVLTSPSHIGSGGEPFVALNEIFVVYAEHPQVIAALKKMHEEIGDEGRLVDNILTLTKAMANAAEVSMQELNDEFITRPFTPPGMGPPD